MFNSGARAPGPQAHPAKLTAKGCPALFALDHRRRAFDRVVYVTSFDPSGDADELGHQLAMRLRGAYARLRRHSNLIFAAFGMTSDQYVVLHVLVEQEALTQEELARCCHSDTATIGAMVVLLERKRLVARLPHPQDGRAWKVQLTASGRALAERMRASSAGLRVRLAGLYEPRELRRLLGYLDRLAGAMMPPRRRIPELSAGKRQGRGSNGARRRGRSKVGRRPRRATAPPHPS